MDEDEWFYQEDRIKDEKAMGDDYGIISNQGVANFTKIQAISTTFISTPHAKVGSEMLELILEIVSHGISIEVFTDERQILSADLNTQGKSECILVQKENGVFAKMRYSEKGPIKTFDDVLDVVDDCRCGRAYFNQDWIKILKEKNIL